MEGGKGERMGTWLVSFPYNCIWQTLCAYIAGMFVCKGNVHCYWPNEKTESKHYAALVGLQHLCGKVDNC